MGAARRLTDRIYDRLVTRKNRTTAALLALAAVPAMAAGLTITVHSGDSLSALAVKYCHGQVNDWTGTYEANKAVIGSNPNLIIPGQKLAIKCYDPPKLLALAGPVHHAASGGKTWGVTFGFPNKCGDGDEDGWDESCARLFPAVAAPVSQHSGFVASAPVQQVSTAGMGGFQSCVISRESGGNSQVMNSTGHYGLYQFDLGTWESGGGAAGDFGHASVGEQNAVFAAVYAARGTSPWAPYDGC
jgi:hypothetical protein